MQVKLGNVGRDKNENRVLTSRLHKGCGHFGTDFCRHVEKYIVLVSDAMKIRRNTQSFL
jgi:hypothetical protein